MSTLEDLARIQAHMTSHFKQLEISIHFGSAFNYKGPFWDVTVRFHPSPDSHIEVKTSRFTIEEALIEAWEKIESIVHQGLPSSVLQPAIEHNPAPAPAPEPAPMSTQIPDDNIPF